MSKIHQAIRKAEREGQLASPTKEERRNRSEDGVRENSSLRSSTLDFQISSAPEESQTTVVVPLSISANSKLVAALAPKSAAAGQYRLLKSKLYEIRETKELKTILITSASSGEGKTLTAANLALTLAQDIDQNVLLVDADFRKPSVHKLLGLSSQEGLSDWVKDNLPTGRVVLNTEVRNFFVTPAGGITQSPTELLNSERLAEFLAETATKFDWVIVDSPSFVPVTDVEVLSSTVDGILIVVRDGKQPSDLFSQNIERFKERNVLGLVLNGVPK